MVVSAEKSTWPSCCHNFKHIARTWDRGLESVSARILPGEYYVTQNQEAITTVLGSCISACIRDPRLGIGGMNHFMLPADAGGDGQWAGSDALVTRYGVAAMESLINDLMKLGSRKANMEVKLFGGGKILAMDMLNVGERNIEFVRQFTQIEGLSVVAQDLGGPHPRKVIYFPTTGKVKIRRLRSLQTKVVAAQEKAYETTLSKQDDTSAGGEIDLF